MALSISSPPTRIDVSQTIPESAITAISVVPPPMSITMLPVGVSTGSPTPMAAAMGSATMYTSFAPAAWALERTARRSSSVIPDGTPTTMVGLSFRNRLEVTVVEEVAEHHLRHVHVRDHPVLERADGRHALGRPAEHPLRFQADPLDLVGRLFHGDHGRLVEDDSLALHVNECIRRPQVDGDVVDRYEAPRLEPAEGHHFLAKKLQASPGGSRQGVKPCENRGLRSRLRYFHTSTHASRVVPRVPRESAGPDAGGMPRGPRFRTASPARAPGPALRGRDRPPGLQFSGAAAILA